MKSQSFKTIKKFASRFCVHRRGRLRRLLLTAIVTGSSFIAAASNGTAEETTPVYSGGISILVHEFRPEIATDAASAETTEIVAAAKPLHRTSSQFNQTIAAAVGSSAVRLGIPVDQFLEPFAMVGRLGQTTPESSPYPASTVESTPLAATPLAESPAADKENEWADAVTAPTPQQQIDAIAALDCWWLGDDEVDWDAKANGVHASITEVAEADDAVVNQIASVNAQGVGSAAIIVTIPDAYFPYDFARRDLELEFLPLTTIQPIRAKNYVSLSEPPNIDSETEIAAVDPTIAISPDCMLDELIHSVAEFAERNHLRDLTLSKIGRSAGNFVASALTLPTDDGSARREIVLSPIEDAELKTDDMIIDEQLAARPVDAEPQRHEVVEEAAIEVSFVQIPNIDTETSFVEEEVAAADTRAGHANGVLIAESDAGEASHFITSEQAPADAPETPAVDEVVVAEIVMMEVDGEQIPAPIADEAPNAIESDQRIAEEPEEAPASVEIAVGKIVIIHEDEDATLAPTAADGSDADIANQFVASDIVTPEVTATASDELTPLAPTEAVWLSQVVDSINQWQQTMATVLSAREVSSLPATAIAEKVNSSDESVTR